MALTLKQADQIIDGALAEARKLGLRPMCVAVLDAGGHLKALKREDGTSILRPEIATGKAWGALGMGESSRSLADRLKDRPSFLAALNTLAGGKVVPAAGGVLLLAGGEVIGAVGATGDTGDNDEACVLAGIKAAGLEAKV